MQRKFVSVFSEQIQIGLTVIIIEKGCCTIIAKLCDMMRITWGDDASYSWHRIRIGGSWKKNNDEIGGVSVRSNS